MLLPPTTASPNGLISRLALTANFLISCVHA
jgi:hypothetical protein